MRRKRALTWLLVLAMSLELTAFPAAAVEEQEEPAAVETAELVLPEGEELTVLPEEFLISEEQQEFSEEAFEEEPFEDEAVLLELPEEESFEFEEEWPEVAPETSTDESGDAGEGGDVELMATVNKTVYCYRRIQITASSSNTFTLYRSPTSTTKEKSGDAYAKTVQTNTDYYVELSNGERRYHIRAYYLSTDEIVDYFVPVTSRVSVVSTTHTWKYNAYAYTESHPYHRRCECGTNDTYSSYDCVICYPSYINYNASGGTGAPAQQKVTTYPTTLSTTKPVYFPKSFAGWGTYSGSSSASYYPGASFEILGDRSVTLYAVWNNPIAKTPSTLATNCAVNFGGEHRYVSFTPTMTDVYEFTSGSSGDTRAFLYDSAETLLASDDDSGDGQNFLIRQTLEAGKTYYYKVQWYGSTTTGTIPVYLRQEFDITFDANGGGNAPAVQNKMQGASVTLNSAVPSHPTKVFAGWAATADAAEAEYQAGDTYTVDGDSTLYAVWADPAGTCGDEAQWEFRDNTLYITGGGEMYDYSTENPAPWKAYSSYIEYIEISDDIGRIGSYAFADCSAVTALELPAFLRSMGSYAFYNCTGLTELEIPYLSMTAENVLTGETVVIGYEGMTVLEEYTFTGCSGLTAISLPPCLTAIGSHAFFGCESLQTLSLPHKLTTLGDYAFGECANLTAVNLPAGVTVIPENLFRGCSALQTMVIPSGVTSIGAYAFYDCAALTELILPDSVTTLGNAAFGYCNSLVTITVPDSVETIGTAVFLNIQEQVTVRCYLNTPIHTYALDKDIRVELLMWGTLEMPVFTTDGQTVTISAPKGSIYYTTDGTEPTEGSLLYTDPIIAKKGMVIRAVAIYPGWTTSPVAEYSTDSVKVATPASNYATGSRLTAGTMVELSCVTEGATILYTTNGYIPTQEDVYTGPIEITEDTTIYAMAVKEGMLDSALAVFSYTLTTTEDIPVIETLEAANVTETGATLRAAVGEGSDVTYVEFIYYEKNNSGAPVRIRADANHEAVITGLSPDTEYRFQATAINDAGLNCGHISTFKTEMADHVRPTVIQLDPTYLTMRVGASKTLLATVLPLSADSRQVYWSSEDPAVATVDQKGVVTAVALGNTRIKATTVSGRLEAYCNLDVVNSDITGIMDFSEINMATNISNTSEHGHDVTVDQGGNAIFATAYLTRWDGAVLEGADPYPNAPSDLKTREVEADYHVQNVLYLPSRQGDLDNDEIKNALMKYGAVYTFFQAKAEYFNRDFSTYCFPKSKVSVGSGHAVAIVGWDDAYSASNFRIPAEGDGAFICKNSWGTDSGEDGYFYISYYDKYLGRGTGDFNTVFCGLESNDNYNKIYQYDYLGPVGKYSLDGVTGYAANVFPQKGSVLTEDETLEAVSFYTYAPGYGYEIYVVTDYQGKSSLKTLGDPVESGVTDYAGYFTIPLDQPITLEAGTRFAVVVKYVSNSKSDVHVFYETPLGNYSSGARANPDESYISRNRKTWMDLTDNIANSNLCIKAFTNTADEDSVLLQGVDNLNRTYTDDTVHTVEDLQAKGAEFNPAFLRQREEDDSVFLLEDEETNGIVAPSIAPDLSASPNYAEGASFPVRYDLREEGGVTPVKNQGNFNTCWTFASYASLESAVLKKSASSRSVSGDGLSQAAGNATSITLNTSILEVAEGSTTQLLATLYPYDSTDALVWKSSDPSVATVNRGVITAVSVGDAKITASTADGSVHAECAVKVQAAEAVETIHMDRSVSELAVGEALLMGYTVSPSTAADEPLVWTVDDASVASIDEYGFVKALSHGTVTVTASTADGTVQQSIIIRVEDGFGLHVRDTLDKTVLENGTLTGSITFTVTNDTGAAVDCQVMLAFYDENGRMVGLCPRGQTLSEGSNRLAFENLQVAEAAEARLFLLSGGSALSSAARAGVD